MEKVCPVCQKITVIVHLSVFSQRKLFLLQTVHFTDIDDCVHITPNKERMFKFAIIYEHHDIYIYVRLHTCQEWAFMLFIYVYARQTLR